jgi:uncharacterized Fe-S cluster-containing radical SAM superfamily protein
MVYITLQKNLGEKGSYSRTVASQPCGNAPREIALRFGGCNIHCWLCFAKGYSWNESYRTHYRVRNNIPIATLVNDFNNIPIPVRGHYNWLRILGGEPLMNDEYINYLFDFLDIISLNDSKKFNEGIIIQTNGIHIGRGHTQVLEERLNKLYSINPNIVIAIETSIKGTNPDEFKVISGVTENFYQFNIQSYYNLLNMNVKNMRAVVIAGFGINESYLTKNKNTPHRISVYHDSGHLAFHPSIWDESFKKLYSDFTSRYSNELNPSFSKMPMYGIKDDAQFAWDCIHDAKNRNLFNGKLYDGADTNPRNIELENQFNDIFDKFFYFAYPNSDQNYYDALIRNI